MKRVELIFNLKTLSLFLLFFVLVTGCKKAQDPETTYPDMRSKKVLARVDGEPVYEGDVVRRIRMTHGNVNDFAFDNNRWQRMIKAGTENEILDKLLLREAIAQGVTASDTEVDSLLNRTREMLKEENFQQMLKRRNVTEQEYREFLKGRALIKNFREQLFKGITVDDNAIKTYFEGHRESFTQPESVRIEILTVQDSKKAEEVIQKAMDGEDFEKLAGEYSTDDTDVKLRRTMWISFEAIPEEVRSQMRSGKIGDIFRPAQVDTRIQVLKILEKRPEYVPTFEEIREDLKNSFLRKEQQKVIDEWYEAARTRAKIEYSK
jgi:foldase protein PrsA